MGKHWYERLPGCWYEDYASNAFTKDGRVYLQRYSDPVEGLLYWVSLRTMDGLRALSGHKTLRGAMKYHGLLKETA